ncbi:hypothetical protein SLS62_005428 [Diatrype stigma]|uniref:Uncharacterized protein n=1 Tax=Diatrype stigma TaxID=117547 RepID=A0AAN9YSK7_9PEZI
MGRLQGHTACTNYLSSSMELRDDPEMEETYVATYDFYQNLWTKAFQGSPFLMTSVNFDYAYDLWDYASYQYNHNATVRGGSIGTTGSAQAGLLSAAEAAKLHQLANQQQYGLNGNLTAYALQPGDRIRAVAGRTLAGRVIAQFQGHLSSRQHTRKLNLMVGSFEPFLAFFALAGLADERSSGLFMQIPPPGSALVFELFSVGGNLSQTESALPVDEDNLWVRFLYRNGTGADEPLRAYPLFGRPNAETAMLWDDFYRNMDGIAVTDPAEWCELCDSSNLFCSALVADHSSDGDGDSSDSDSPSDGAGVGSESLSPTVAGVIGALTTFAAMILLALGAWLLTSVRLTRRRPVDPRPQGHRKRSSSRRLGGFRGFRGTEKMESDHDVSITRNGAKHARVGSWELGASGGPGGAPQLPPPAALSVSPPSTSSGATVIGASVKRDDEDADSITGKTPVLPHESV